MAEEHGDLNLNGIGGFSGDGREYVVRIPGGHATPQPWINVIPTRNLVSTSRPKARASPGAPPRDYQLTPWTNDAVINRPGEAIYAMDRDSGAVMTPFAALSDRQDIQFEARQ